METIAENGDTQDSKTVENLELLALEKRDFDDEEGIEEDDS